MDEDERGVGDSDEAPAERGDGPRKTSSERWWLLMPLVFEAVQTAHEVWAWAHGT